LIVVDASVAVAALLGHRDARELLAGDVNAPHLIDSEVASALRRHASAGALTGEAAHAALQVWASLGIQRYPAVGLLDRIWELRANLTAYDATYVALSERLGAELVTLDRRLAGAPGVTCRVSVLATSLLPE
jgi:predicted nucleic acid-binding protein